jgi:NADH dehydrogenase [ubiquinone] 1 alpha subcomplex assembly factor 1
MKNMIIAMFFGLCLMGCAYIGEEQLSIQNIQSNYLIKEINSQQAKLNMSPTETPMQTPETSLDPNSSEENMFLPGTEIFAFVEREPSWYTVDDNVMGGVSSSTVKIIDTEILSFSGNMSLENNGGFSSVRSDRYPIDLTSADGMLLRVLGDGKMYRLRIYSESTGNNIAYNATFETTPENWILVYIPFSSMVPTYFGNIVDVGSLDTSNIRSFGFMLSDKQPGEFDLQVDWIRAISEQDLPIFGLN